jgi:hypothetical protein
MAHPSISDFRDTLKIFEDKKIYADGRIYSYWNNRGVSCLASLEEALHIKEERDGPFVLEIGNITYKGSLAELEKKLYEWAAAEGWLDDSD